MVKKLGMCVSLGLLTAALFSPVFAAAPVKVTKDVAPVEDLVAEAEAKIKLLEEHLANNDSYLAAAKQGVPTDAGVLAVLAQAIAEHADKSKLSASAGDLRDAAVKIATSKTLADAQAGLKAAKEAAGGKTGAASKDAEWNKLVKLGALMSEVNKRNGKLRRATRSLEDGDAAQASRDASVLAVLALATHADTHEVKKKEDTPKWQAFSLDMQKGMSALSAELRKKNAAGAKDAFVTASKSCSDCHKVFRDE